MAAAFMELGIMPEIGEAVSELDWLLPTDVQAEAVPLILGGGDVLMAAETGSGKTGAFCMPILQIVWETLKHIEEGKGGGGGGLSAPPADDKWAMSLRDRGELLAVSPDGLVCQCREQRAWYGVRATRGLRRAGRWYYEATVTDEGLCRVGWSTRQATLDLGTDRGGYGYGGTGKKSNNRQFDDYGGPFGKDDVIGCYLDLDNLEMYFSKNGKDLGKAFDIPKQVANEGLFPAVVLKNAEMAFNFGDTSFKYPPSHGFVAVSKAPEDSTLNNAASAPQTTAKRGYAKNAPQAIILEPSRELAEQTLRQIQLFKKHLKAPTVREVLLIGGVPAREQRDQVLAGVDIVVATPGRIEDFINNGDVRVDACRFFVLDEADGLLKQGHEKMINRLHAAIPQVTPDGARLQMVVCSATLHSFEVKKMAGRLMHFPTWVDLKGEDAVPETVHHVLTMIDPRTNASWTDLKQRVQTDMVHAKDNVRPGSNSSETLSEAVKLLKAEFCVRAIDVHKMDRALIFCRTKLDCDNLERYLVQRGGGPRSPNNPYSCVCLHSDRSVGERKDNLERFKRQEVRFLICTDVAARGLDITGLPFMINVTLPDEKTNYVHRIGRVGRADRMGLAVSLVSAVPEKVWYHGCPSRGKSCMDTRLTERGGCCIWYDEVKLLGEIEEHLGITIPQVGNDLRVPVNEFDGKVVYGERRQESGTGYQNHVEQMASTVRELASLETQAQTLFIRRHLHRLTA
ncbi:ATP-dependent RNA helicase Ddx1-like isoform X1 [Amphibalanus amphitrite]|nr:ATP-dependent RNA helicase Ddx1-like isoform X1 [Amphibalanus amphitrite]XP_043242488.1 ATP-dependent RNA helicase Ddx1-like isoform X1 [Amphibalanus amphitrite]XP_043242489.1 ATP-dependent RNA helicase Ddx1-like isoform X1 [Amphibalanus amphitrite]